MNSEEIFYPDRKIIEEWIKFLKRENLSLKLKLPTTDEDWFTKVLDTIERIKVSYILGLHSKVAHLFYYLDKDHNFLDGNKRTAIVTTYLVYILNGYKLTSPDKIRTLAKKVAMSHGSSHKDEWLEKIEKELESIRVKIEIRS